MPAPLVPAEYSASDLQRCGYVPFQKPGYRAIALEWAASVVAEALAVGTLHDWAALQPVREAMHGRAVIFAVDLPTIPATPVVVRRNRHGGLLGALTGECFLAPTRAPLELSTSLRLAAAGIPTPEVIAYAVYPVAGIFARSDVMTRRLPAGDDLPLAWKNSNSDGHDALLVAVANLLRALAGAGAWHADLNLKNIYIAGSGSAVTAYLLDVDRVTFPAGGNIASRNFKRLARSARKWRERWGLAFGEEDLARLAVMAGENL